MGHLTWNRDIDHIDTIENANIDEEDLEKKNSITIRHDRIIRISEIMFKYKNKLGLSCVKLRLSLSYPAQ